GKSTLLKVLAGFYPLDAGQLRINGLSLRQFGLRRYRQCVAYVTAHDEIIAGSVLENIVMDSDGSDAAHLKACVEQAGLLDSILGLSNGFNTLVGSMGVQLSSGQKQRLLIARALYRRPELLLLDEPTSHLDPGARDVIIETIRRLPMLCVIVTHDRAVALACDQIWLMRQGSLRPLGRRRT
ncbi:ATP-binding cassette domain-containing protein, partial [Pseudomonas asplenii]|uniref:ATP-binding cassette domain-containing protein n=2 Tax=Pseudomonas TaxID=286 RepID=UPI0006CD7EA9